MFNGFIHITFAEGLDPLTTSHRGIGSSCPRILSSFLGRAATLAPFVGGYKETRKWTILRFYRLLTVIVLLTSKKTDDEKYYIVYACIPTINLLEVRIFEPGSKNWKGIWAKVCPDYLVILSYTYSLKSNLILPNKFGDITFGHIVIFQPRFPWNKVISLPKTTFWGSRSCEDRY